MTNLSKQVHIYSLATDNFYTHKERKLHRKLMKVNRYGNHLKTLDYDVKEHIQYANKRKQMLKGKLKEEFANNKNIRQLNPGALKENNVISVFVSVLTRTLGINKNELTEDIIVVQAYYFEVLEDLINDGFVHNGEKYIYFSSSSGQIRTKKTVFIKEELWEKHQFTLMCGLSVEDINKQGGMSVNKFLSYKALTNGASAEWKDFDIHKTIVVDDVEIDLFREVDYIERETFEITRKKMPITLEITDGAGMILPNVSDKSFQFRMPFMKGLLSPFDFKRFSNEHNATKVTDVYGKEWDILEDGIEIIFFKSQFKMKNYYESWDDYKEKFIKYNCQAAYMNVEEDFIPNAKLNYQMLQTLSDLTDGELKELAQDTIKDIIEIGSDKETMLRVLGATEGNSGKNSFQQALYLHNELLNDVHSKEVIKNKKKFMVKDAKSGKLNIDGKFIFVLPDFYAVCESVFLGIDNPTGLLNDGEVFTNTYDDGTLDILRSPHLYLEHSLRKNVKDDVKKQWFRTSGIYISGHDLLPKIIMCDFDGDKVLTTPNETLVNAARRNTKDIVPLEYEMSTAPEQIINGGNIYQSLTIAFKSNIGTTSNDISKVWNSEYIDLDVIKILAAYNNYIIDHAKTLDLPEIPEEVKDVLKLYTKKKVPYFFKYAKDKEIHNVEEINNSPVNRLDNIIPNKRISFKKIAGNFDYKILMKNPRTKIDDAIVEVYTKLDRSKKWLMKKDDDINSNDKLNVYTYIRDELLQINADSEYVADVLVKHLYMDKNSKSKTTLWESFGGEVVKALTHNINVTKDCADCGTAIERVKGKKYCSDCARERQLIQIKNYQYSKNLKTKTS